MARRTARPAAPRQYRLEPYQRRCPACGGPARVAYHDQRTVATLDGLYDLTLVVRLCRDPACPPVKKKPVGLPSASTVAWIVVLNPPLLRPIASSPSPPFSRLANSPCGW